MTPWNERQSSAFLRYWRTRAMVRKLEAEENPRLTKKGERYKADVAESQMCDSLIRCIDLELRRRGEEP